MITVSNTAHSHIERRLNCQEKRSAMLAPCSDGSRRLHHNVPQRAHTGTSTTPYHSGLAANSVSSTNFNSNCMISVTTPNTPMCGSFSTSRKRCGSRWAAPNASATSPSPSRCSAPVTHTHTSNAITPANQGRSPKPYSGSANSTPMIAPTSG
ncbi:hypothetical protein D3C71_1690030 [compost metagenome]